MKHLQQKDEQYIWHPYTHQKDRLPAIPVVRGDKAVLVTENGDRYIDAISSWWVNIHGHGNRYIAKKIYEQAKKLQQVIFTGFTHEPAVALAEKLLKVLPGDFSKIFYSDDGSTSTEVALKMTIQYWKNSGDSRRNKIIAFHNSYHGDTFGAMSISERGIYTFAFQDKLFDVVFIDVPDGSNGEKIKSQVEPVKDEAVCFIYEPLLQGAGGMLMHEPGDLDELLSYMKACGILCIADEVLTGFYRTGKFFAGDYMKEKADIICLSKALTGGTMALGVTACTQKIYEAFVSDDKTKTLFHGHSFTGNALACAASVASLELLQKEKVRQAIENILAQQERFLRKLQPFEKKGAIKNTRRCGTIVAFELCTPEKDNYLNTVSKDFTAFGLRRGVYLRSMGNTIYVMPPYCITTSQLKKCYSVIASFIRRYAADGSGD